MQSLGTAVFRLKTCLPLAVADYLPAAMWPAPSLSCRADDDTSTWVIAVPAKSGAVLSAKFLMDIGALCGMCVASGERSHAGIPGR